MYSILSFQVFFLALYFYSHVSYSRSQVPGTSLVSRDLQRGGEGLAEQEVPGGAQDTGEAGRGCVREGPPLIRSEGHK